LKLAVEKVVEYELIIMIIVLQLVLAIFSN